MTSAAALDAEPTVFVKLEIIKAENRAANHYNATTDINISIKGMLQAMVTPLAVQDKHIYTTFQPGPVEFLTGLPETLANLLIPKEAFVVVTDIGAYRLKPVLYTQKDFIKRSEQEGVNYGHLILPPGFAASEDVIKAGATAHLDSMGYKFNSLNVRLDEGGFPTREWRIGWIVTEHLNMSAVANISKMKVGGVEMLFKPCRRFCTAKGLHEKAGCFKFLPEKKMLPHLTCQCGQMGSGAGSSTGGQAHKRTAQEAFHQRSKARQSKAPEGF